MKKREVKFKNKIKQYRENHKIDIKDLAECIGRSVNNVHHLERTKAFPHGKTRKKIMEFLGASFNEIFYEE